MDYHTYQFVHSPQLIYTHTENRKGNMNYLHLRNFQIPLFTVVLNVRVSMCRMREYFIHFPATSIYTAHNHIRTVPHFCYRQFTVLVISRMQIFHIACSVFCVCS